MTIDPALVAVFNSMPPPYPFACPYLFRHVAREMAGRFYDGTQRFNLPALPRREAETRRDYAGPRSEKFRDLFKSEKAYVAWMWPYFVKDAREVCVIQLREGSGVSRFQKEEIYEALLKAYDARAYDHDNIADLVARTIHARRKAAA
jgi:hypothetical protein